MSEIQSAITAAAELARNWPTWPVYGLTDDLLPTIERWAQAGHRVALATLTTVVGTSPRPLGSEMAICDTGEVMGYVSGGCVEGAVAAEALAVMEEGTPRLLDYGAGSPVLDVQLTCGGRIGIFVRELADAADYAARLRAARTRREPIEVEVDLRTGAQRYRTPGSDGGSRSALTASGSVFIKTYLPTIRLVVIGSNPVALALCQIAPLFGYEVGLLRPFGPESPPPDADLVYYDRRPIEKAAPDMPIDAWTAVYALTHHPEEDLVVLVRALRSSAFCVGVLGSRTKISERLLRLGTAGLDEAAIERLHAPAGLAIGACGPREIALSVLGQVVSAQPRPACRAPDNLIGPAAGMSCARTAVAENRAVAH
ncbi:MAG: XdhC family protein [Rhodanobacteraceae bacterium]